MRDAVAGALSEGWSGGLSPTCCGLSLLVQFEPNLAKSCHAHLRQLNNVLRTKIGDFWKPQNSEESPCHRRETEECELLNAEEAR